MSELQIDFAGQVTQFGLSVVLGVAIAAVYDLIKSVRLFFKFKKATVFLFDVVFFILSALVTYLFLLGWCKGEIRFYVVAGECIGVAVYRFLISKYVVDFLTALLKILVKIISPFRIAAIKIYKFILNGINKLFFVKKYLKKLYSSLYNVKSSVVLKRRNRNEENKGQHFA